MNTALLLSKVKVWTQRLQTYIGLINFFMIFYIFVGDNEWIPWYYRIVVIGGICSSIVYVDVKHIMGNSLGYQWDKNKSFKRLEDKVDKILEQIQ